MIIKEFMRVGEICDALLLTVFHNIRCPRAIAATPLLLTSASPNDRINSRNAFNLSVAPVSSNTKLPGVASTTRARKASARRSASGL